MIEKITIDKALFDDMLKAVGMIKEETENLYLWKIFEEIEDKAEKAENEHYKRMREERR